MCVIRNTQDVLFNINLTEIESPDIYNENWRNLVLGQLCTRVFPEQNCLVLDRVNTIKNILLVNSIGE